MSDNIKKIEDQGWAIMSVKLDKDLPLKKRRRNFFLWFLSAAIFVGVCAVFLFNFDGTAMPKVSNTIIADANDDSVKSSAHEVKNNENIIPFSNKNVKKTEMLVAESKKIEKSATVSSPNKSTTLSNNVNISNLNDPQDTQGKRLENVVPYNSKKENVDNKKENDIVIANALVANEIKKEATLIEKNENAEINQTFKFDDSKNFVVQNEHINFLNAIISKDIQSAHLDKISMSNDRLFYVTNDIKPIYKPINKLILSSGIGIKILPESNNSFILAGIDLGYFLNKNWKLNTGIFYSRTNNSTDSLSVTHQYAQVNIIEKDINASGVTFNNYTLNKISVSNQAYIHIPLTLEYIVSKNIGVKAGVFVEKIISKNLSYELSNSLVNTDMQNKEIIQRYIGQKVLNYNFNYSVGLTIFPKNRMSFSIDVFKNNKFISGKSYDANATKTLPFIQILGRFKIAQFWKSTS